MAKTLFVKLSQMTMGRFDGRTETVDGHVLQDIFLFFSSNPSIVPEMHTVSAANTKPQTIGDPANKTTETERYVLHQTFILG